MDVDLELPVGVLYGEQNFKGTCAGAAARSGIVAVVVHVGVPYQTVTILVGDKCIPVFLHVQTNHFTLLVAGEVELAVDEVLTPAFLFGCGSVDPPFGCTANDYAVLEFFIPSLLKRAVGIVGEGVHGEVDGTKTLVREH